MFFDFLKKKPKVNRRVPKIESIPTKEVSRVAYRDVERYQQAVLADVELRKIVLLATAVANADVAETGSRYRLKKLQVANPEFQRVVICASAFCELNYPGKKFRVKSVKKRSE